MCVGVWCIIFKVICVFIECFVIEIWLGVVVSIVVVMVVSEV